jgi:F-type H+-transporting ATPase subunit gamma
MAALRDIRKRIRSTRNSQKITKAMKLVAASKFKRAQDAMLQARPYASLVEQLLRRVAKRANSEAKLGEAALHPLLEQRPVRRVLLIVLTSDRGLCGGFNSSLLRRADRFLWQNADRFERIEVAPLGRKARDFFNKRKDVTQRSFGAPSGDTSYAEAQRISAALVQAYAAKEFDGVYVLYNAFVSAIAQQVTLNDILPVPDEVPPAGAAGSAPVAGASDAAVADYLYEPDRTAVLSELLPRYVATLVWRAMLESVACEHGARMTAMDAATRNARELTDKLTLQYNRARQATITRELMDIVGGAEAQSG